MLCWDGGDHTIITTQHMPHHACILGISATVWVGLVITSCTVHVAAILHHGISLIQETGMFTVSTSKIVILAIQVFVKNSKKKIFLIAPSPSSFVVLFQYRV